MTRRYIDEDELEATIQEHLPDGPDRNRLLDAVGRWLRRQPRFPRMIGATAAAKLLGVRPPHISRLREKGRMPEALPVRGGFDVYDEGDVEALARDLRRERRERAQKRARKEAGCP